MFDSNYRVIVDNVPKRAITYTNMGASQKEMLDTADKLAKLIVKNYDKMTQREKRIFGSMKIRKKQKQKSQKKN